MPATPVSNKIIVARHIIGVALALLFVPYQEGYLIGWFAAVLLTLLVSLVVTGFIWLFFTETQRENSQRNFIRSVWVVAFFAGTGTWMQYWPSAKYAPLVVLAAYLCIKAYAKRKT